MSKRIVITGSAGFVGSSCVQFILENTDWEIIGFDSFRHKGDSLRVIKDARLKTFSLDLTSPVSERLSKDIGNVDYIINCASMSHVDTSISDPIPFWENNTKLIGNILEFARSKKVSAFIQCSTDEVFGPAHGDYKHHETDVIIPSNPYAASKAAQEALCIAYRRTFDVPVIITRCMNMVYKMQDQEKFLPMLIRKIYRGETVSIHGQPGRIGSRMYLDSRNLADAWVFLLRNHNILKYDGSKDEVQYPSCFNIAGLETVSNLDLAKRVAKLLNKPLKYELVDFHSVRPGHDLSYALDCTKLYAAGWKHPYSLDETLKFIVDWTLANPAWL